MNDNGKFRKRNGYTITGNTLTRDPSISLKAKGLYLVIMSYITSPDLDLTKDFILKQCKEGPKGFDSSWNELKENGYLKVYFTPTNKGFQAEYELLDEPQSGPHTFYLDREGNIKSSNLDRKLKKQFNTSELPKEDTQKNNSSKETSETPQKDDVERSPQKGSNGRSDDEKRYPQKGSNAKGSNVFGNNAFGGNNINTTNNTMNNYNLSIYPKKTDGWMEESVTSSSSKQIIPYELSMQKKEMETLIKDLASFETYGNNEEYTDLEQSTHNLIVECLVEMATERKSQKYNGSLVTYVNVIDKINEVCNSGEILPLHFFIEVTMEDYINAAKTKDIKNIKAYIKSCIWSSFSTYKVKWQGFFERTQK